MHDTHIHIFDAPRILRKCVCMCGAPHKFHLSSDARRMYTNDDTTTTAAPRAAAHSQPLIAKCAPSDLKLFLFNDIAYKLCQR